MVNLLDMDARNRVILDAPNTISIHDTLHQEANPSEYLEKLILRAKRNMWCVQILKHTIVCYPSPGGCKWPHIKCVNGNS